MSKEKQTGNCICNCYWCNLVPVRHDICNFDCDRIYTDESSRPILMPVTNTKKGKPEITCTSIDCPERKSICCKAKPKLFKEKKSISYKCSACGLPFRGGECIANKECKHEWVTYPIEGRQEVVCEHCRKNYRSFPEHVGYIKPECDPHHIVQSMISHGDISHPGGEQFCSMCNKTLRELLIEAYRQGIDDICESVRKIKNSIDGNICCTCIYEINAIGMQGKNGACGCYCHNNKK